MENKWNDDDASNYKTDLALRVYSSRLLGQDSRLVLHGGGNTSVKISEKNIVELDEERKASMVSNLLVVLCSDKSTQPVVNTGTIY